MNFFQKPANIFDLIIGIPIFLYFAFFFSAGTNFMFYVLYVVGGTAIGISILVISVMRNWQNKLRKSRKRQEYDPEFSIAIRESEYKEDGFRF